MDLLPGRRRILLGAWAAASTCLLAPRRGAAQGGGDAQHQTRIEMPLIAEDPAAVPLQVWVDHPMEPDHFIRSIEVRLETDPVPAKGTFHFTPGSGRPWVAFSMRSGAGGEVTAVAECSRHGKHAARRAVRVTDGGCATGGEAVDRTRLGRPQLRVAGTPRPGEPVEVRARLDHPSHTGLALRGGKYVREGVELHLKQVLVLVDDRQVSDFQLTPAISPNPVLRFTVRAPRSGTLKVVFINNEGQRWEAIQPLRG